MLAYKLIVAFSIIALYAISNCNGDIVKTLLDRFNDNRTACRDRKGNEHPAYKCDSGLLIRGVRRIGRTTKYAWGFKEGNINRTSFSVGYLREDTPFSTFPSGYDAGFIIFPHWKTPKGINSYRVFCIFPLDGHTDGRKGKHGCGQSRDDPTGTSIHCDDLSITTFGKWMTHYYAIRQGGNYFVRRQCSLDMTLSDASKYFKIFLKANRFIRNDKDAQKAGYSYRNNEILMNMWNADNPIKIPIEAFFYLLDTPNGLTNARAYQSEFHMLTGITRPIVGIRLPNANRRDLVIQLAP